MLLVVGSYGLVLVTEICYFTDSAVETVIIIYSRMKINVHMLLFSISVNNS